jgi:hypothetical protein
LLHFAIVEGSVRVPSTEIVESHSNVTDEDDGPPPLEDMSTYVKSITNARKFPSENLELHNANSKERPVTYDKDTLAQEIPNPFLIKRSETAKRNSGVCLARFHFLVSLN